MFGVSVNAVLGRWIVCWNYTETFHIWECVWNIYETFVWPFRMFTRKIPIRADKSNNQQNFTSVLPCIVIDFFLIAKHAVINQIYSVIKLYIFRVSSLPIIRSSLLYIRHWQVSCRFMMTVSKQSKDGTDSTCFEHPLCPSSGVPYCTFSTGKLHAGLWSPYPSRVRMELCSILTLLGSGHQKPACNLPVPNVQ